MTPWDLPHTGRAPGPQQAGRRLPRIAVGVCVAAALLLIAAEQSAVAGTTEDRNLTVEIVDDVRPTPSPSGTPTPTTSGSPPPTAPVRPSGPGTTSAVATQATIPGPAGAEEALGEEPVSIGGLLSMSGLSAEASPSLDIGNGAVALSFVVRNTSRESIDASARFWVDSEIGLTVADVPDVRIEGLAPDETRRVQVRISGIGQHVVLHNHATLTPPETVEGMPLEPLTRDVTIVVPPLFSMSVIGGVGALGGLAWWVFSMQGLGFRFGRWGL